jgi:tetratricopeptide (TPR) repeat protein
VGPAWWGVLAALAVGVLAAEIWAQGAGRGVPAGGKPPQGIGDIELVEKLLAARREYRRCLEKLRLYYIDSGDVERARWTEEELKQYHRIAKQAYRLDLDVPPPTLQGNQNIPEANKLYQRAIAYKDKGWATDYVDNQRRAELLFQQLLSQYPQSDKIGDTAYQLGEIYESRAYKQYRRAAMYYERCFQWHQHTHFDARLKAARLYDRYLLDRGRAIELYKEVTTHETDEKRIEEAKKRLAELSGGR